MDLHLLAAAGLALIGSTLAAVVVTGVARVRADWHLVTRPARQIGPSGVTGACRTREAARRA